MCSEPDDSRVRGKDGGSTHVGPVPGFLDLSITDGDTGQQVAKPRINLQADSMAGGWSIGGSDRNLLDYITAVSYQYLKDNY